MTSRERILATLAGRETDRLPFTTWCFGFKPPDAMRWGRNGSTRTFWYTKRLEHLHTLPQDWELEDDFNRARAWLNLGIDDLLEISVPWSRAPGVAIRDTESPAGDLDARYPVLVRQYDTPAGGLRHAVKQTGENPGVGWVVQPDHVPLIEDYNIPRGVEHAVSSPADIDKLAYLYAPPDNEARQWFRERAAEVKPFADSAGVAVQAWAGFGMDAVVWFTGVEQAVLMAMDEPEAFQRLMDIITETDLARARLAAATPGVDLICGRGWYSSTDFWSPALFDRFVFPHIKALADAAHEHGKPFGYVMTTGVRKLGPRLVDAGVDLLYFIDPAQDGIAPEEARDLFGGRIALAGGVNTLTLASGKPDAIRAAVRRAVGALKPDGRFILHPVDAVFPDTPWDGLECMIEAWRETAG
jgi:hypothetical protein